MSRDGCGNALVLDILLSEDSTDRIGDGKLGDDYAVDDALRREVFNAKADQFIATLSHRTQFGHLDGARADI